MRKTVLIALLVTVAARAQFPQAIGFVPVSIDAAVTSASGISTTKWIAYGFTPRQDETLSQLTFYISALSGAVDGAEVTCALYGDVDGAPGGSAVGSHALPAGALSAGWQTCSGFNDAVQAGTRYWMVVSKNSGSNTFSAQYGATSSGPLAWGTGMNGQWLVKTTTDGVTWTTAARYSLIGYRVGYASGRYGGFAAQAFTTSDTVYGTREVGVMFTLPAGASVRVAGILMAVRRSNNPGPLHFKIYTGASATPTLVKTSREIPANAVGNSVYYLYTLLFDGPATLADNAAVRVVMGTSGGSASNYYYSPGISIPNDAASKGLMPLGAKKTFSSDGTSFSETDTQLYPFALILDEAQPFQSAGATGGGAWTFLQ